MDTTGVTRTPAAGAVLHVLDADGRGLNLEFPGIDTTEAMRRVRQRGLRVLSVQTAPLLPPPRGQRLSLSLFNQELLALLKAGLNLSEAIETLVAKEEHPATSALLATLLRSLREGRNFSDVLAGLPQHFPDVYVATVRAAERTGDLPQALARYVAYQGQFEALRKKLVAAAIYPAVLLVVGGCVTLFLLGYVVPRFAIVYESSGRQLPWLSQLLLSFGHMLYGHWLWALAALVLLLCGLVAVAARAGGRRWVLEQALRLPWLARRADQFRMARFYRAVSLLLAAGIALPRAMGMVTGLLGPADQARFARCRQAIEHGQTLSAALAAAQLASPVAASLIKVGERSGQLGDMLERTASFADEEFSRWIDTASRLLEPLLMVAIGLVIGTVVVLMYMPIFELAGSF